MQKNQIVFPDYNNSILNFSCSILNHFGAKVHHSTLSCADQILCKNYKNVVVILLDGLGINILEKHLKPNDFFFIVTFPHCKVNCIFPQKALQMIKKFVKGLANASLS